MHLRGNTMHSIKDIRNEFYRIGRTYPKNVLLGYICFFSENWIDPNSKILGVRLNGLRLKVYQRIAKEKSFLK